jgi:endonuclease/exonuclease/phosphatase (EEP) superfamily protein YafD
MSSSSCCDTNTTDTPSEQHKPASPTEWWWGHNHDDAQRHSLTLVTFNVARGRPSGAAPTSWTQADSLSAMQQEILVHRPDIIALQEFPWILPGEDPILFPEYQLVGYTKSHAPYVVLYVHKELKTTRIPTEKDGMPAVIAEIDFSSAGPNNSHDPAKRLWVASLHLEPFGSGANIRRQQLQYLVDHAKAANSVPFILAGDTNMRVAEDTVAEHPTKGLGMTDLWKAAGSDIRTKYTVSCGSEP